MQRADSIDLLSLLHLASPVLPVGGFAYSQGLEWAIEDGVVCNPASAYAWIRDCLCHGMARQELVLWRSCHNAMMCNDHRSLSILNDRILALKETSELRLEALQMGQSLALLFPLWDDTGRLPSMVLELKWTYPAAFAALCAVAGIDESAGMTCYAWTWTENQVLAAVKHVPLGQTEGQRILRALRSDIGDAVQIAQQLTLDEIGTAMLGVAIASARHETQYSRLFRS